MYKWPQGKFIRMALLVLTIIAAIDCGWESYVTVTTWMEAGEQAIWQQLVVAGVLAWRRAR